jgi:pimeloyl-ACP methyl ester carboxylesterase
MFISSKNFWKHGLRTVWGKPSLVSDSDVLRFQWPSIGLGWEKGLLSFTRAQFSVKSDFTDRQLLEKVLAMPNTRVIVVLGTADRVIPANAVRKFFKPYTDVAIVELEGQGHDPFEEDVDMFVQTVKKVLQSENKPSGGVLEEASRLS